MAEVPLEPKSPFNWRSLDNIEQIAKIFSIILVPVVVAIIGGAIQKIVDDNKAAIEDKKIALEYVKLAKEILARDEKQIGDLPDPLISWAWQLISDVSPTKIPPGSLAQLQEKKTPLPVDLRAAPRLEDYKTMFQSAIISHGSRAHVTQIADIIIRNKDRYMKVEEKTGVPWFVIGILHGLEAGLNFRTILGSGDPLTGRAPGAPQGGTAADSAPLTWEEGAVDAFRGFDKLKSWSVPDILLNLERYNGLGYRREGIPSPYIWACTNQYTRGKYVRDGVFDPNLVSQQCGAAAILKNLAERNAIDLGN